MVQIVRYITYQWSVHQYDHTFYLNSSCYFFCDKKSIWNFAIFICLHQQSWYKIPISGVMLKVAPDYKIPSVSCDLSKKYLLRIFALEGIISINACIFCDSLWYVLVSDVLSIFGDLYAQAIGFSIHQWPFLIWSVRFRTIYDEIIIQSTSNAHIYFLTIMFNSLNIRVPWIEGWFLIATIISPP